METSVDVDFLTKKRRMSSVFSELIQQNGLSEVEVIECYKSTIRRLSLNWVFLLFEDLFSSLLLAHLTLTDIVIFDSALCNRTARPLWLKLLQKNVSLSSTTINWSDSVIMWIISKRLHLDGLIIAEGYSNISNAGMYKLAQHSVDLKTLQIIYAGEIDDNDRRLQYITAICNTLTTVELSGEFPMSYVDFVGLGCCEQLQSLKLQFEFLEDDEMLKSALKLLLKNKKHLKLIEIGGDVEVLFELGTYSPNLEHASFECLRATTSQIEVFAKGCRQLKSFKLSPNMDTDLRNILVDSLGMYCPLLEELVVINAGFVNLETTNNTTGALKSLAEGCPLLRKFHFHGCILPAEGVTHLVDHCAALTDLSFLSCKDMSDQVLVEIGRLKHVHHLNISNCAGITDNGIKALVTMNGSNLHSMNICGCQCLTDATLASLMEHCPNLISLHISNKHDNMTLVGLLRLLQKCPKLVDYKGVYSGVEEISNEINLRKKMARLLLFKQNNIKLDATSFLCIGVTKSV